MHPAVFVRLLTWVGYHLADGGSTSGGQLNIPVVFLRESGEVFREGTEPPVANPRLGRWGRDWGCGKRDWEFRDFDRWGRASM